MHIVSAQAHQIIRPSSQFYLRILVKTLFLLGSLYFFFFGMSDRVTALQCTPCDCGGFCSSGFVRTLGYCNLTACNLSDCYIEPSNGLKYCNGTIRVCQKYLCKDGTTTSCCNDCYDYYPEDYCGYTASSGEQDFCGTCEAGEGAPVCREQYRSCWISASDDGACCPEYACWDGRTAGYNECLTPNCQATLSGTCQLLQKATGEYYSKVNLNWSDVGYEYAYRISRGGSVKTSVDPNVTAWADPDELTPGTTYTYSVDPKYRYSWTGYSYKSCSKSVTCPPVPCSVNSVSATDGALSDKIGISWTCLTCDQYERADNDGGFKVWAETDGWNTVVNQTTRFAEHTGLSPGFSDTYCVACRKADNSLYNQKCDPGSTRLPTPTSTPTPACGTHTCVGDADCPLGCQCCLDFVCPVACPTATPTPTNTPIPTSTPTGIPTSTPTPTATPTPACGTHTCAGDADCPLGCQCCLDFVCPVACPTATPIPTNTPVPTATPTGIPTSTPTPTATPTPACGTHTCVGDLDCPLDCQCCLDFVCPVACPTATPIPTNTPIPTSTPTNTPTPTSIPTSTPTPTATPTPACGTHTCVGDLDCPLGCQCCLDFVCPVACPTPTAVPTTPSLLCCIKERGWGDAHCWAEGKTYEGGVYWPLGTPCAKYCSAGSVEGQWCSLGGGGEPCRSCSCSSPSPEQFGNFQIGQGESKDLTVNYLPYKPGSCSNPSTVYYKWYAMPSFSSGSQSVAGRDNINKTLGPFLGWFAVYEEFTPRFSGYLSSAVLTISSEAEGYFNTLVSQVDKTRISDNRGEKDGQLYGGVEKWFKPGGGRWSLQFQYLNYYVEEGKTYRLYLTQRGNEVGKWINYTLYAVPSERIEVGSFSDASRCNGQSSCTVTYTAPSSASPGTRFKILAEISDNQSIWQGKFGSGNCLGEATIRPPAERSWFQTQDIDVYSGGKISSKIPASATNPYFSLKGVGGSPGVVVYKGAEAYFDKGTVSEKGWLVNASYQGKKIDFQYLKNRLKIDVEEAKANPFPASSSPESKIYYAEGAQTVAADWNISEGVKAIVFVDGDLTFEKDIEVDQAGFLAVVASGNITFGEDVSGAQGLFVASGSIIVDSAAPDPDIQFKGEGSFIGWGGVQLLRDLGEAANKKTPAEIFSSRPDSYLTLLEDFTYSLIYREELLP